MADSLRVDPEADGCELDRSEEVVGPSVVASSQATHLFGAVEEALDDVALAIDPSTEGYGGLSH